MTAYLRLPEAVTGYITRFWPMRWYEKLACIFCPFLSFFLLHGFWMQWLEHEQPYQTIQ